jgi:hypothetical protein
VAFCLNRIIAPGNAKKRLDVDCFFL